MKPDNPRVVTLIQARMASSRLPGKVLRDLGGQPVLAWAVERCRRAKSASQVVVATTDDSADDPVAQLCQEAAEFHFASVCINPVHVGACAELLRGSGVAVCTVVGFPLGATTTEVKVFETRQAMDRGATEIDMVIHVGALKSRDLAGVETDIGRVARECGRDALLKVIIEAALLTDEEKVQACAIAQLAGADFVKTSTGFGPGGATLHDVELMRRTVGEDLGVKAAGGIRDRDTAERMIAAGADRIGASASVKILHERSAPRA